MLIQPTTIDARFWHRLAASFFRASRRETMPFEIHGRHQLKRTQTATAAASVLWDILSDSRLLPHWAPAVHAVEKCEVGGEVVGAVRHCRVELGGRTGRMVEECVDMVPGQSITYAVRDDSFGMARMFSDYSFRISLGSLGPRRTEVVIDTYYTPKNGMYALMNATFMRRQFASVVAQLLSGLCSLAEKRAATVTGHSDRASAGRL
jgi:hypothetical protein